MQGEGGTRDGAPGVTPRRRRLRFDTWKRQLTALAELLDAAADELFHRYRNDQDLTPDLRMPPRATLLALAAIELFREALAKDPATSTPARPDVSLIINAGR